MEVHVAAASEAIVSTVCHLGPDEILDRGRFGRLVLVSDLASHRAALKRELGAPDVGPAARRAERAEWMRQFDPEVITQHYLELVREVIAESAA